jgi:hypothetical protein
VDNPVRASWDIGTLSYAGMLSLPEYGFEQYYQDTYAQPMPFYLRPSRRQVADYLAAYPSHVGIDSSIHSSIEISGGSRCPRGFHFASHGISCKHLVLATGIFSQLIPARPLLQPLLKLQPESETPSSHPILVVGSGFSAADIVISTPVDQKIIHIFKWDPAKTPSPLRACHQQAYPEYAGVYRRMKLAALASRTSRDLRPKPTRRKSSAFDLSRDWQTHYEGMPNTEITNVEITGSGAVVTLRDDAGEEFERPISRLAYVVGRRGSLAYLDSDILKELGVSSQNARLLSSQSLRARLIESVEVSKDIFAVGSLTGDSLIRFAYGSCASTAGLIMSRHDCVCATENTKPRIGTKRPQTPCVVEIAHTGQLMNGLDGHNDSPH